jgi:hypothetical protein
MTAWIAQLFVSLAEPAQIHAAGGLTAREKAMNERIEAAVERVRRAVLEMKMLDGEIDAAARARSEAHQRFERLNENRRPLEWELSAAQLALRAELEAV